MSNKVLVAGARGMLGQQVVKLFGSHREVVGVDLPECDITRDDELRPFIEQIAPGLIINCAAMTDVDGCEDAEEAALAVNGHGAGNLARAAATLGAKIVHLSTDYVFDGSAMREYVESDPVAPLGAYGRSKLLGEELVAEASRRHWIVRTQWLYGPGGKNFVDTIIHLASQRDRLDVVDDQFGCPTSTVDLARALLAIVEHEVPFGIYHCASQGFCSWFELARRIVALADKRGVEVFRMSSDRLDRKAPRPAYSVLRNLRLEQTIGECMPRWQDALESYLAGNI